MLLEKDPKRLGIFFFYDSEGVVDTYVETMLGDMSANLTELAIVVNGYISPKSYTKLREYSKNILLRDNTGFDVWAYRSMLKKYGWEALQKFDEVILFNATIMGPVYPFSEMFSAMDKKDLDFWGITAYHAYPDDPFGTMPDGYVPTHIQSHFHAYRRSLVESNEFQNYWENLPEINSYGDSVGMHEAPFTQRFERLGFTWETYVPADYLEDYTYQPILFAPKKLIEEKRCPIFKRRSFFHDYNDSLNQSVGNATVELYEYLRDHTSFDTHLIWDNALRTMHMADLVRTLKLTYVLPDKVALPSTEKKLPKTALILHIYYEDLIEQTLGYARSMPDYADIIFTVADEHTAELVRAATENFSQTIKIIPIQNVGRDVSALLVGTKDIINDYDVVCFAHDKKVTQLSPYSIGDGFAFKCFENILGTPELVENILNKFIEEPRLGLLAPTAPNHAEYFLPYANSWGPNFENTEKLLKELSIKVPLSHDKEPITPLGTMFWFRPAALKPLFDADWQWADFPPEPNNIDGTLLHAIERAYGFSAQSAGYFCGWIFSDSFARIELTNLSHNLQQFAYGTAVSVGGGTAQEMLYRLNYHRPARLRRVKKVARIIIPARYHQTVKHAYTRVRRTLP